MDELSDLDHIRKRSGMYIGNTGEGGLHHIFDELLDNSLDQFLAGSATSVTASTDGASLEFSDDGPGLPFDLACDYADSLATHYLTEIRRNSPTADGHTPHVHLGGWGCGLRIVTALTETCSVTSCRDGNVWSQSFTKGIPDSPAAIVLQDNSSGTKFSLTVDRDIFSCDWSQQRLDRRLLDAAYLFPGFRVESPNIQFVAPNGLADMAAEYVADIGAADRNHVWWFNGSTDEMLIQASIAGTTDSETEWRAFANGSTSIEKGTHLTALKRVVASCRIRPAIASVHVVMNTPRFAGPTRTKLDVPEILSPIYQALKPSLAEFVSGL
ncbi:MAG: ATP-binding protein [Planctomycetota bacterium]